MITIDELAYELWLADVPSDDPATMAIVRDFLDAHGINVNSHRVPESARVRVTRNDDGTFQFSCWIHQEGSPLCGTCKSEVLTEQVLVPLAAGVPVIPGARFWPAGASLQRILPEDLEAVAQAADRHYLERHSREAVRAVDLLHQRQNSLGRYREIARANAEVRA